MCFLGAIIPQRAWSSPAQKLLQYVPSPNAGDNTLSTGAFAQTVVDDKGSFRVDGNTKLFGLLTGYYFLDDYTLDNPYPGQQGGANVPGFDAQTIGRAQLFTLEQREDVRSEHGQRLSRQPDAQRATTSACRTAART